MKGKISPHIRSSSVLNYKLEIVGNEYVIFIDHYNKYYVNLLFGRSIYRPECTHMGNNRQFQDLENAKLWP